ncbi:MAG: (d)CMP kinase [Clostridiales Family XIII bacterium]|jgi:cytidylate kinase|nr:(d)CMP kinase [Clostridiales Family XIII bacterium]
MTQAYQIAIDGPSGAGKSSVAKKLAARLNIDYIDTGAMYRAVAYKMLREGIGIEDREALKAMLENIHIDFSRGETILDDEVISEKIRTPEISKLASDASALPEVREKLVSLQRAMGESKSVVMDGREIGTVVFPKAKYKFFLTATVKERAKRRWLELREKGLDVELDDVEADIIQRDHNDSTRALNPLRKAEDAIEIDTTAMNLEQVTQHILSYIE